VRGASPSPPPFPAPRPIRPLSQAFLQRVSPSPEDPVTLGVQPALLLHQQVPACPGPLVPLECAPIGPDATLAAHAQHLRAALEALPPAPAGAAACEAALVVVPWGAGGLAAGADLASGSDLALVWEPAPRGQAAQMGLLWNSALFLEASAALLAEHLQVGGGARLGPKARCAAQAQRSTPNRRACPHPNNSVSSQVFLDAAFASPPPAPGAATGAAPLPLLRLPLMTDAERRRVLSGFAGEALDYDTSAAGLLPARFAAAAAARPGAPCVLFEGRIHTYGEVRARG
jgi:hypothetical protein